MIQWDVCQKDIAEKIIDKKADYLLALKGNQSTLFENVVEWFDFAENNNFGDFELHDNRTFDKGHGRIEKEYIIFQKILIGYIARLIGKILTA